MGKPTTHRRPERPEQHEIDEAAQRIFIQALPLGWVHRKQDPDYRVDYLVEIGKEGNLTGLTVGVQLREKRMLKIREGYVSYSIETKHLDYYLKRREPIFLVLADVTAGKAYWLFTQQYALESLAGKDWHNQQSVVVRVPADNLLSDLVKLEKAARDADRYMAGVRPAATEAALRVERQRLEALDSRFGVAVAATEKACHYTLNAKEDVTFGLKFKGDPNKVSKLVEDLVDRGLPIQFAPGEAEISGSALIAKAFEAGGTLHAAREFDALVRLSALSENGSERCAIEMPARFEGGRSESRGRAELPSAPLRLELTIRFDDGAAKSIECSVSFAHEKWTRKPILHLPYFDQTHSILQAVHDGATLQIDVLFEGARMFGFHIEASMAQQHLNEFGKIAGTYSKARALARILGVNPQLPSDLTYGELNEIETLYWLFMPGEKKGVGVKMSVHLGKHEVAKMLEATEGLVDAPLVLRSPGESVCLLRQTVSAGPSECELTHARLAIPIEEPRKLASESNDDVRVPFVGTADSTLFIRRG